MDDKAKHMVFSDVIYVPHAHNQQSTVFVKITTVSGLDLMMTGNHLIPGKQRPLFLGRRVNLRILLLLLTCLTRSIIHLRVIISKSLNYLKRKSHPNTTFTHCF